MAAPIAADDRRRQGRRGPTSFGAVLVAERFDATSAATPIPLTELAQLCRQPLARAAELDRFPLRTALGWSDRLAALAEPARAYRTLVGVGAVAALAAALAFIPADYQVDAPATLHAAVERDVFASATASVAEVRVAQGDRVDRGDVLVVLRDPELALQWQHVQGEMDAAQQRLGAVALARTDRTLRDEQRDDGLPLSVEQRQLEERLASLRAQAALLQASREALVIRSPVAGQVLTPDVESLLETRPVERGQVLLTVADAAAGWELAAELPQRRVGAVVEALAEGDSGVAASIRLAGDVAHSHAGRVVRLASAVPLEADGLQDPAPPVEVRLALTDPPPPAARPGMSATVRIHCGQRSLGYVWLHDVLATVYRWLTF